MEKKETHYDVLRIERGATVSEIVAAYHAAKSAFSKDSLATYTLFSGAEADKLLKRIEEAYMVLSNIDRRRDYDKRLDSNDFTEAPMNYAPPQSEMPSTPSAMELAPTNAPITDGELPQPFTGASLKEIRTQRNLSLEDVSRITKIPTRFIRAIEDQDAKTMPARVYLQGFIKSMSAVYKIPAQKAAKAYLEFLDASGFVSQ